MLNSFKYQGLIFIPKRAFSKSESDKGIKLPFRSIGMHAYGESSKRLARPYNYEEFYEAARAKNGGKCEFDVFEYNGEEVVPCENELFHLDFSRCSTWELPPIPKPSLFSVTVFFGDQEVLDYLNHQEVDLENLSDGFIKTYYFENADQLKGFEQGLDAMHGQLEYTFI